MIPEPFLIQYYSGSDSTSPLNKPIPTISTHDRHALVEPALESDIEDCGFRMFQPHEVKDGMGFKNEYVLLGNSRQQVKLAGNAVTPPVAEWLFRQCAKTFD